MKLIKPFYEIITPIDGEEILKQTELAARTCYKSEDKIEIGHRAPNGELYDLEAISARVLLPKLIARGHEAMLEFGGMINVKFTCDRGVSHELVRHRLCSFAQESTRYCNYGKSDDITFIIPCWFGTDKTEGIFKEPIITIDNTMDEAICYWFNDMLKAESTYNRLIKLGWSPQEARSVLPNSLKTEVNMSANIREWRKIFQLRTSNAAHPQMRELMRPLLDEFKQRIPILFDDINY